MSTPREMVGPCLLLLLAEEASHGYVLRDRLSEFGFTWDGPGPVYRELKAMAAAGLITSTISTQSRGPAARVFTLTPAGRRALTESAGAAAAFQRTLALFLARCEAVGVSTDDGAATGGGRASPPPRR